MESAGAALGVPQAEANPGLRGGALVVSLPLFPFLPSRFVPTLRERTFLVRSMLPPRANLHSAMEYAQPVDSVLRGLSEVAGVHFDSAGRVLVADLYNDHIQVFGCTSCDSE